MNIPVPCVKYQAKIVFESSWGRRKRKKSSASWRNDGICYVSAFSISRCDVSVFSSKHVSCICLRFLDCASLFRRTCICTSYPLNSWVALVFQSLFLTLSDHGVSWWLRDGFLDFKTHIMKSVFWKWTAGWIFPDIFCSTIIAPW